MSIFEKFCWFKVLEPSTILGRYIPNKKSWARTRAPVHLILENREKSGEKGFLSNLDQYYHSGVQRRQKRAHTPNLFLVVCEWSIRWLLLSFVPKTNEISSNFVLNLETDPRNNIRREAPRGSLTENSFVRAQEKKRLNDQEYFPAQIILLTFSEVRKKNAD